MSSSANAPLVDIRNLTVRFTRGARPVDAVNGVDLAIQRGEVVALITRSGQDTYSTDFGVVQADGTVSLHAQARRLRFVSKSADMTGSGSDGTPAILVQLSGVPLTDLKSGIFVPDQATSDAR